MFVDPEHDQDEFGCHTCENDAGEDTGNARHNDDETAERLALRLTPGTTWVSHILQRLTLALVTDPAVRGGIDRAAGHYAARNDAFAAALEARLLEAKRKKLKLKKEAKKKR